MTTQVAPSMLANSGYELGSWNRIINGACQVAQRGNIAAANNSWTYGGCDRIPVGPVGFTTFSGTLQQSTPSFTDNGPSQALGAVTTTGTGTIQFQQRIEATNCYGLNSKPVIGAFWVFQDTGTALSFEAAIFKANTTDNFGAQTKLISNTTTIQSNTWTQVTVSGTLGASDANNGLALNAAFLSVGAVTNKNFLITRLQFGIGPALPPFEFRPYGTELALCQRYYETFSQGLVAAVFSTTTILVMGTYKVTKRAVPTIAIPTLGTLIYQGSSTAITSVGGSASVSIDSFELDVTGSGLITGSAGNWRSGLITASIEL